MGYLLVLRLFFSPLIDKRNNIVVSISIDIKCDAQPFIIKIIQFPPFNSATDKLVESI